MHLIDHRSIFAIRGRQITRSPSHLYVSYPNLTGNQLPLLLSSRTCFCAMVALRLSWNNPESLELQKTYNVVSPRRGVMVATIFFQCVLGTACTPPPSCQN
jgi:hypothetical protein